MKINPPETYLKRLPSWVKWVLYLLPVIIAAVGAIVGARAWLENYVESIVDARMHSGPFKQDVVNEINRFLVFDVNGAVLKDPSKLYGNLVTGITTEKRADPPWGMNTVITIRFSRFVELEPVIRQYDGITQIISRKRMSAVDWRFDLAGPIDANGDGKRNENASYLLQVFP